MSAPPQSPGEASQQKPAGSPTAPQGDGYFRWYLFGGLNVLLGALAMVGTLPGRTYGLGLVTKDLTADFHLDDQSFAHINLVATLIGALGCFPAGWLIDRAGTRWSLALVSLSLGAVCWVMSGLTGVVGLLVAVTLTRAIGQSALSLVSMAVVGKWFKRHVSTAMAVFSILLAVGFGLAFKGVGWAVRTQGWRTAWWEISLALAFGLAPLAALLVRSNPDRYQRGRSVDPSPAAPVDGYSFAAALRTPAFWVFALSASLYGLVSSGMGLFNEAILAARGFDREIYHHILELGAYIGLGGQLLAGALGWKVPLPRILAGAMFLYAAALLWLPHVESLPELYGYAVLLGLSGGIITVCFFAVWPQAFGRASLGQIQGAAQMLTVLASALGPEIFPYCRTWTGSYWPVLYMLAPLVALLGMIASVLRLPAPPETIDGQAASAVS